MKHRPSRVRELLLRELGAIITRELTFEAALVTVRDASLTADFKHAHVHVGVIGDGAAKHRALAQLDQNRVMLQRELAKRVILKFTPQLHFHLDESAERGTRIMSILEELDLPPAVDAYGDAVEDDADEPALGVLTPTDAAAEIMKAPVNEEADADEDDEPADSTAPRRRAPRR